MITVEDAQKACADPAPPSTSAPQESGEGTQDPEYLELAETRQHSLHKTLYQAYEAAPAERGAIDEALDTHTSAPVPCNLLRRAELLGISPSIWFEVSQRSRNAIEEFLRAEERVDDPGASSSADRHAH